MTVTEDDQEHLRGFFELQHRAAEMGELSLHEMHTSIIEGVSYAAEAWSAVFDMWEGCGIEEAEAGTHYNQGICEALDIVFGITCSVPELINKIHMHRMQGYWTSEIEKDGISFIRVYRRMEAGKSWRVAEFYRAPCDSSLAPAKARANKFISDLMDEE